LVNNPAGGAYLQIGADPESRLKTYRSHNPAAAEMLLMEPWMSSREVAEAAGYGTTLKRMTPAEFDLLERHGYETAKWNLMLFVPSEAGHRQLAGEAELFQ
jgi:NTE family protein